MQIKLPQHVEHIIGRLNEHGFEAYAVGGCVRDSLMERAPEDWDITTSAKPEQVKEIFSRTIDTGIIHGTVTVLIGKTGYEVTTYRIDGEYEDGRHPKFVEFTSNLTEDLKRRDFTINAMAYSYKTGIVDKFSGISDMHSKLIRCVGSPIERFTEDALRILRAIRFSAQLDFEIEENTLEAISKIAPNIVHVSRERIQAELTKLLLSDNPERIKLVYETGISRYISKLFSEINSNEIKINNKLPKEKYIRWAAFLHLTKPQEAQTILKELKMDNYTTDRVRMLVQWWNYEIPEDKASVRKVMSKMTEELFFALITLQESIECGEDVHYEKIRNYGREIIEAGDCIRINMLAVTGKDLIAGGMKPGREIGEALNKMLELVLEKPECNKKDYLMSYLK